MNQHNVQLLDLLNEILFFILKKLDNIDVLYSLLGTNDQRLDVIVQNQIFTNNLTFVSVSSNEDISSISDSILDRFCSDILPRIHYNVKSFTLESASMERILLATDYPNLTKLKLFNFNKQIVSRYFKNDSIFRQICKQHITDLILIINENNFKISWKSYTKNVYAFILTFFASLKHLTIIPSSINKYPRFSLCDLPPTTFSSSILTKLRVNADSFNDCLTLLDGRLKQLTTFIIQIIEIRDPTSTSYNMDDLPNLRCFSLTCYNSTAEYDSRIIPLLRRMSHLEELTLYLRILGGQLLIDGTHLHNKILIYMPRLQTFTFYISNQNVIADPTLRLSNDSIQRTFTSAQYQQIACMVDYFDPCKFICHAFSLPFQFDRLKNITNKFPNIVFNYVTHLMVHDTVGFKHEFFIWVARSFPLLKYLTISNIRPPFWKFQEPPTVDNNPFLIVEYPHLILLDVIGADSYYLDQFLNETKTNLPRLAELKVTYDFLKDVTENFTRDTTRRNCAAVKRFLVGNYRTYPEDFYRYFPSLCESNLTDII